MTKEELKIYQREWSARNRDQIKERQRLYYLDNRDTILAHQKEYQQIKHDERLAYANKWSRENKDKIRQYYEKAKDKKSEYARNRWIENRDKIDVDLRREKFRAWRESNPHKVSALGAKRRADVLRQTPKWLTVDDLKAISDLYALSIQMTRETGVRYCVDHIIPLCGKYARGLHTPWNLQVITSKENHRKINHYEVVIEPFNVSQIFRNRITTTSE